MPALALAALLAAFRQFCQELPEPFGSLEPLDEPAPPDLQAALGARGAAFAPSAQEDLGGYVAFWQAPGRAPDARPVAWLSGDGSPLAVCAASLAEFLTLLPYGPDFISDVLTTCEDEERRPGRVAPTAACYPPAEVAGCLAAHAALPVYARYHRWLTDTAGLAPAPARHRPGPRRLPRLRRLAPRLTGGQRPAAAPGGPVGRRGRPGSTW